ncbi:MAG: alpha/beta fold hydrolase [Betaproteobacteria bacterium]
MKSDRQHSGRSPWEAQSADSMPVPDHGSLCGLGADGLHRLHFCDWGRQDNPRVVFCVHGDGRHAREFDVLARALATDFRVICPDLSVRGAGDWLGTATQHTSEQLREDLVTLLSHLEIDQVDWIGASLGGQIGLRLAAQPGTPIRRLFVTDAETFPHAISPAEIADIREFMDANDTSRFANQRSLRAGALLSASTRRSTRMGLVR